MNSTASERCASSNIKLTTVSGSLVAIGALTALGIVGGIELHNKLDALRAVAIAQLELNKKSSEPSEAPSSRPTLRPSSLPTQTSSPSTLPSTSVNPTTMPSMIPSASAAPSTLPSQAPTASASPSAKPSMEPSVNPTFGPSSFPSASPTLSVRPTFYPTRQPTQKPTIPPTTRPTNKPINVPSSFRLRLHWEQGYMWQEDPREMWFCMACAHCNTNIFEEHCDIMDYCSDRMMLALTDCRPGKWDLSAEFSLLTEHNGLFDNDLEGDQIQVTGSNFCLSLSGARAITLETCDSSKIEQRFTGFRTEGDAIEIAPAKRYKENGITEERCLTQHHHPREGERIYSEECRLARISKTNYWTLH